MGYEAIVKLEEQPSREFIVQWPDDDKDKMLEVVKDISVSLAGNYVSGNKEIRCHCTIIHCGDPDSDFEKMELLISHSVPNQYATRQPSEGEKE